MFIQAHTVRKRDNSFKRGLDFGSGDGAFFRYMSSSLTIDALDPFLKPKYKSRKLLPDLAEGLTISTI